MIVDKEEVDVPKLLLALAGIIVLLSGLIAAYFAIPNMQQLKDHFKHIYDSMNTPLISIILLC